MGLQVTTLNIRADDISVMLALVEVPIADHSPLQQLLEGTSVAHSNPDDLRSRGLLVDAAGRTRPNVAVATALATLAQPEECAEFRFVDSSGERSVHVARVRSHPVALASTNGELALRFPADRLAMVSTIRSELGSTLASGAELDFWVSPSGQFLLGVLAKYSESGPLTAAEVSMHADHEMLTSERIVGAAALEPGCIDRLHRNASEVDAQLSALVAVGAVNVVGRLFTLDQELAALLHMVPQGTLFASRYVRGAPQLDSFSFIRFESAILQVQNVEVNGHATVHLSVPSPAQVATTVSALLFSDAELAAFSETVS